MGKSHGRAEGEHCGHEPLSERAKGFAFFNGAFDGGFDRGAGARISSRRRIPAR